MSVGIVSDITMAIYCSTDSITFTRILTDCQAYMAVFYTVEYEESKTYYFRWSDIPREIYTLYLHSKMFSKIVYNDYSNEYVLFGTHFLRKHEHEYVLAYYSTDVFPIMQEEVLIDHVCSDINDFADDDRVFFTDLVQDMLKVKNYSANFIRGPSVVKGG